MEIKGIVFDMDGVVLDTEKLYIRFWCEAADFYGYPMERYHALAIRSMARPFAIEKLKSFFGQDFDYHAVHQKRIELMDKYISENGIEKKPYAEELLSFLKDNGYKTAIATATAPERTEKYLEQVGLYKYFDKVVCASMVKQGKPKPDIYLRACQELQLKPKECMAIEDSPNGIRSASGAGCVTVMVPDQDEPNEEIRSLTYSVVKNLNEVKKLLLK
ncbi:MAG: HAD family hydrolase [Ruminococcus sp.]